MSRWRRRALTPNPPPVQGFIRMNSWTGGGSKLAGSSSRRVRVPHAPSSVSTVGDGAWEARTLRWTSLVCRCSVAIFVLAAGCASRQPMTLADSPPPPVMIAADSGFSASRAEAIQGYEQFLQSARDPLLRAEALRRLADLRLESDEARLESAEDTDTADTEAAILLYKQRLQDFPRSPDSDQVRYQLARAHETLGQREQALAELDRLAARHPESALLAEAQFRRGEMLFIAGAYPAAEQAYAAVLAQGGETGFYSTALYKRGWALFKQHDHSGAIDDFMAVLDLDVAAIGSGEAGLAHEQGADALRGVSLSFSYLNGPPSVAAYYRNRADQRHQDRVYQALGDLYLEKERYSDAAGSYEAFVAAAPTHGQAPLFQLRAIDIYQQAGFSTELLAGKQRFVELYHFGSGYWQHRAPADHPEVVKPLEATLRDLAGHYHALAQKNKRGADFRAAQRWYGQYLTDLDDQPGAQEMRFLYAELLFEHQDFATAAQHYEQAAYSYGSHGRAAEAGHAALLAYDAHAALLSDESALAWEMLALASAERFAAAFPEHAEAAPALAHAAERLFARGESAAALRTAGMLLTDIPAATLAQQLTAWTIIGHISFDQGDYLRAEQAYQQSLASPALAPAQRPALRERLAASIYQQAEQARERGDLALAVEDFLRVGLMVPESDIRASAEYDAAALLVQLQEWPRAIAVLEAFRQRYPDHRLQPEVTQSLAVAYLENTQPANAAREFMRIAEESSDAATRRAALLRAAELYQQALMPAQAAATLEHYLTHYPRPLPDALEARQQLIDFYEAGKEAASLRRARLEMIAADRGAGPERSERSRFLAAQASLALAEETLPEYRAIRLSEPVARSLPRKRAAMQRALDAYGSAAEYGVAAVSTAATYAIADLYADFSLALLGSDRPADLDDEALEQYELMLEEEAYPFEEQAIKLHQLNTSRVTSGIYNDWVRKSFAALARLMPARYAKLERKHDLVETLH